jgi:DNA-binding IclR family transcriptional regulator
MKKVDKNLNKELVKEKSIYNPIVPAVEQALNILTCLGENSGSSMRLTEICRKVDIHKSKGYTLLNTLMEKGFVEKDPNTKTYSLGLFLLFLSRRMLDHLDLRSVVSPFLDRLALETQSTAFLGLINGDQVFVVAKKDGSNNNRVSAAVGNRFHITTGAHGKAILAFMSKEERTRILSGAELNFYGFNKPLDKKRLEKELKEIRKQKFAKDDGDLTPGINGVSSPVFSSTGGMIGCVLIMGTFPKKESEDFGFIVKDTAEQISYKLGADINLAFH